MNAVVAGGPGLVAVGYAGTADDVDAAVWVSSDGISWTRVTHDESVFGGQYTEMMTSLVAGGPGLIAVGYDMYHPAGASPTSQRREADAAVWISPDGLVWSRVPHSEGVFGGDYWLEMSAITAVGDGFVAVGYRGLAGTTSAAVWLSPDGLSWSRVPHSEPVFGGYGDQRMRGVTAGPAGVIAVGVDQADEGTFDAAVWTSADGNGWSRVAHDDTVFGGRGDQEMNAVAATGFGLIAVGSRWVPEQPGDRFSVVWVSADGSEWSQVPYDENVFGGRGAQVMWAVAPGGPGVVAVGEDSAFTGGTHAWVSADGLTWSRVLIDEAVRPYGDDTGTVFVPPGGHGWYALGELRGVSVGGPGLVAVGTTFLADKAVVLFSPAAQ